MLERIGRSFRLSKASAVMLTQQRDLLLFPLASVACLLLLSLTFLLPAVGIALLGGYRASPTQPVTLAVWTLVFVFYFGQYFAMFYFNAALVAAALTRLDGGTPTFRASLRMASARAGTIAGYALLAATVGLALQALQGRLGFVGPLDAVKRSTALIRTTWGENVIGRVGLGAAFACIFLAVVGIDLVIVTAAVTTGSVAAIAVAVILAVLLAGVTVLLHNALSGIYSAALYRYALKGEGALGFDADSLRVAFGPK